jgi:hypothetical protein
VRSLHTPGPGIGGGVESRLGLDSLLEAIASAREKEREEQRRIGCSSVAMTRLRWDTLAALEAYADALDSLAWPVPRQFQQQMDLRRALLSRPTSSSLTRLGSLRT